MPLLDASLMPELLCKFTVPDRFEPELSLLNKALEPLMLMVLAIFTPRICSCAPLETVTVPVPNAELCAAAREPELTIVPPVKSFAPLSTRTPCP